jgi:hypothetical protein
MRTTEHFKNHLRVVTEIDGKVTSNIRVEDPFAHTSVIVGWNLWDWFKMLFSRSRELRIRVDIRGDGVAQARWFRGVDVCERCQRTPIGIPHDGSAAHDPGYHHGEERLCESCYYDYPQKASVAAEVNGCMKSTN